MAQMMPFVAALVQCQARYSTLMAQQGLQRLRSNVVDLEKKLSNAMTATKIYTDAVHTIRVRKLNGLVALPVMLEQRNYAEESIYTAHNVCIIFVYITTETLPPTLM